MHLYLTGISLVYILSGLLGFGVSLYALPRYLFTYRASHRVASADRRRAWLVNVGVVVTEFIRFLIHITTTAVGIQSLFISPTATVYADTYHRIFGFEVLVALLVANFGTTINSALVWWQYKALRSPRVREEFRSAGAELSLLQRLKRQIRWLLRRQDTMEVRAEVTNETVVDHEARIAAVEEVVRAKAVEEECD